MCEILCWYCDCKFGGEVVVIIIDGMKELNLMFEFNFVFWCFYGYLENVLNILFMLLLICKNLEICEM